MPTKPDRNHGGYTPPDLDAIGRYAAGLRQRRFAGRAGATDVAVAEALVAFASRRARGLRFAASVDEIAAEAGVHRVTARHSLRRLCVDGLLAKVSAPGVLHATEWVLVTGGAPAPVRGVLEGCLGEDWARWGAVGKAAARVWRELDTVEGRSAAGVARRLGVGRNTVHKHLKRLYALGAVERTGRLWVRREIVGLAGLYGVEGARERERAAVRERRELRRDLLEGRGWVAARGLVNGDGASGVSPAAPHMDRGTDRSAPDMNLSSPRCAPRSRNG